jgi:hypothetical protein
MKKYDMSKTCAFKNFDMWKAHVENRITDEEYYSWYDQHCGRCKYMCEICMWGEEVPQEREDALQVYLPDEEEITTLWYEEHPDANPQSAEELLDTIGLVYSTEYVYSKAIEAAENALLAHQHLQEERERWFTLQQEYAGNFN